MQSPAAWAGGRRRRRRGRRQLARRRSSDEQLAAAVAEAHRAQRRPAGRRGARRTGAAPRQARRREALSVGRPAGARRRQDVGRRLGLQGAVLNGGLGARSVGPRALRARGGARRGRVGAADFEFARQSIAALVAKSWFLATEAGLQAEVARADESRDARSWCGWPSERVARRRRQRREMSSSPRADVGTYRDACARSSSGANRRSGRSSCCSGAIPSAATTPSAAAARQPGEVPAGLPSRAAGAASRRHRRGAPGGGRVQSDRRSQGGAPAGDRADRRRQLDLERFVRAAGPRQSRCGVSARTCSCRSSGAAR